MGGVRGSLMSGRQKKSYCVGRSGERHDELARNQCVVTAKWRKRFRATRYIPSGGIQGGGEPLDSSELRWERITDKRCLLVSGYGLLPD